MAISTAPGARRPLFEDVHDDYRESFRRFLQAEVVPHHEEWQEAHIVSRELFTKAAEHGFLAMAVPEEYGGAGVDDWRFNAILAEEAAYAGVQSSWMGPTVHTRPRAALPHGRRPTRSRSSAGSRASPPARRSSRSR